MKLTVSNFQIHQKPKTVDIPEGETTYLEGDSDTGKSALMRAMRWLCENKPDGGSFVTFKQPRGTNARAMLEVDGRLVMRERGKSTNLYKMDGETFEAFGRSVPEPISKFLALSPYAFQLQGEAPFLIGASPTDAAKILSDACGLGVIDTAVQFVRGKKTAVEADIRKAEILLESSQKRLSQATESLPLADALEAAARVGDEQQVLSDMRDSAASLLEDEPQGTPWDTSEARALHAKASGLWNEMGEIAGRAGRLRIALHDEPQGECVILTAVYPALGRGHSLSEEAGRLAQSAISLRSALEKEPKGEPLDVSGAKELIGRTRILGEWIADVSKSAERIRQRLQDEPVGEQRDVSEVLPLVRRALSVFDEAAMLDKMTTTIWAALQNEPQGVLEDTTELLKQRAQIKVCATCGREL